MLFAPEIRYQSISAEDLQSLAEDLQRALPGATVTPVNQRARPTDWQSGDVVALQLKHDDRKKPFMMLAVKGADIAPQHSDPDTLTTALKLLSEKLELQKPGDAAGGVICTIGFLAMFGFFLVERAVPEHMTMAGIFGAGVFLFVVGLVMFGLRGSTAPRKGVSKLSLFLIIPGFLMAAPLSLLNLPLINYLRRLQGSRLFNQLA